MKFQPKENPKSLFAIELKLESSAPPPFPTPTHLRELRRQSFYYDLPNFPDLCFKIGPPTTPGRGGVRFIKMIRTLYDYHIIHP